MLFDHGGTVPLVAAEKDVLADDVPATPCGELDVVGEQHRSLLTRIDSERVIACPGQAGTTDGPSFMPLCAQRSGDTRVYILVENEPHRQATAFRRTASMSASVRSGYASNTSAVDRPA